jgi:transposase InsO family protein
LLAQRTGEDPPSERTVGRAMALNRQHHDAPGPWITDKHPPPADAELKYLPFEPTHRHRYWFVDYRYLVRLAAGDHWAYSLCIFEGYSRKILAGMATEYQDTVAVLQLLSAVLAEYGRPEGIVSDNGAVFTSDAYEGLLQALQIEVCHIEKGKPWENLAEAQFKIQLRLADAQFEQAAGLSEIQERHADFVETFNTTPHWAHRERPDGLRTPEAVLSWARGRDLEAGTLQQALCHLQVERVVNLRGYVSVQRFYIYAERGLARTRVSVWLYDGRLQVAYQEALLARYTYRYDRKARRLRTVEGPQLFNTTYGSPQLELFELDDEQWQKVARRPYERHAPPPESGARQLLLPLVGLILSLLAARAG